MYTKEKIHVLTACYEYDGLAFFLPRKICKYLYEAESAYKWKKGEHAMKTVAIIAAAIMVTVGVAGVIYCGLKNKSEA